MKYTVTSNGDMVKTDLSESEAVKAAEVAADKYKDEQVLVEWFRESDGQKGFLNKSGNHAITGESW